MPDISFITSRNNALKLRDMLFEHKDVYDAYKKDGERDLFSSNVKRVDDLIKQAEEGVENTLSSEQHLKKKVALDSNTRKLLNKIDSELNHFSVLQRAFDAALPKAPTHEPGTHAAAPARATKSDVPLAAKARVKPKDDLSAAARVAEIQENRAALRKKMAEFQKTNTALLAKVRADAAHAAKLAEQVRQMERVVAKEKTDASKQHNASAQAISGKEESIKPVTAGPAADTASKSVPLAQVVEGARRAQAARDAAATPPMSEEEQDLLAKGILASQQRQQAILDQHKPDAAPVVDHQFSEEDIEAVKDSQQRMLDMYQKETGHESASAAESSYEEKRSDVQTQISNDYKIAMRLALAEMSPLPNSSGTAEAEAEAEAEEDTTRRPS